MLPTQPKPLSLPPPRGSITPSTPLRGSLDERALIEAMPASHLVKGMFFSRLVDDLEGDWAKVSSELRAPPALGRYIPFSDYPNADHLLLAFRSAKKRYPTLDLSEGLRRVAREHVKTFLGSTLGRISSAMIGDVGGALAALPSLYARVIMGPRYGYEPRREGCAVLTLQGGYGPWENVIGQVEGIVLHYGGQPTIVCATRGDDVKELEIRWR